MAVVVTDFKLEEIQGRSRTIQNVLSTTTVCHIISKSLIPQVETLIFIFYKSASSKTFIQTRRI